MSSNDSDKIEDNDKEGKDSEGSDQSETLLGILAQDNRNHKTRNGCGSHNQKNYCCAIQIAPCCTYGGQYIVVCPLLQRIKH